LETERLGDGVFHPRFTLLTKGKIMQVLAKNILILKHKNEYTGLIQGVESDENTYGKILGIGTDVTTVELGQIVMLDWNKSKKVKNDLYVIQEEDIIAILEEEDLK
jgi:co-chaperonin GroES (HSP10)